MTHATQTNDDMKRIDRRFHHTSIVPALFNPRQFTNDVRYLECDKNPQILRKSNTIQASVKFVQIDFPESSSHLKRRKIMYVRILQFTDKGEKLFVGY